MNYLVKGPLARTQWVLRRLPLSLTFCNPMSSAIFSFLLVRIERHFVKLLPSFVFGFFFVLVGKRAAWFSPYALAGKSNLSAWWNIGNQSPFNRWETGRGGDINPKTRHHQILTTKAPSDSIKLNMTSVYYSYFYHHLNQLDGTRTWLLFCLNFKRLLSSFHLLIDHRWSWSQREPQREWTATNAQGTNHKTWVKFLLWTMSLLTWLPISTEMAINSYLNITAALWLVPAAMVAVPSLRGLRNRRSLHRSPPNSKIASNCHLHCIKRVWFNEMIDQLDGLVLVLINLLALVDTIC